MEVTKAFTVKWPYAWAIMHGIKTAEFRSSVPSPIRGRCAVHMSRSVTREDYEAILNDIRETWGDENVTGESIANQVPPYEVLASRAGKIIGVVDYDATEEPQTIWSLSNPQWLRHFLPVSGHLGLWDLDPTTRQSINFQDAVGRLGWGSGL